MRRNFLKSVMMLMAATAVLAWPMLVRAGAPAVSDTTFTYQGFLTQTGTPFTGQADFKASAWDNSAGGAQVTNELELIGVNVNDGLFSIPLNFGANWLSGEPRWLKISARTPSGAGDYTDLSPLQPLSVAPYAIQTRGLHVPDNLNVGVGTTTPEAMLHVYRPGDKNIPAMRVVTDTSFNLPSWLDFRGNDMDAYNVFGDGNLSLNRNSTGDVFLAGGGGRVVIGDNSGNHPTVWNCTVKDALGIYSSDTRFYMTSVSDVGRIYFSHGGSGGRRIEVRLTSIYLASDVGINLENPLHPLHVGTGPSDGNGAHLTEGGVWTNGSDVNTKQDFETIDGRDILEKVSALPVTKWRYIGEGEDVRHIGPMAQDFMAAFGLGESERHIGTVDADGVALAAIQGLNEIVKEQQTAIQAQAAMIEELKIQLAELKQTAGKP